jgi:hypothetical protein
LIVGHGYSPELWLKLFGALKFAKQFEGALAPRRSLKRPWKAKGPPKPEIIAPASGPSESDFLSCLGVEDGELERAEILMDINSLLALGQTNEAICKELELSPESAALVQDIRERRLASA